MAAPQDSVSEQIRKLDDARKLVLKDVGYYPQVVQGILPSINTESSSPELRRWISDFLAEAFATPALPSSQKETLGLMVLEPLKTIIDNPKEDVYVLRSALQTAASIYPFAMRWIITNDYDQHTLERVTTMKTRILRLWEGAPTPIRLACIKFAQRVVLAQTVGPPPEHKLGQGLDISLASIPPNHKILDPRHLEAEATGLLDRMLAVLQENSSDALVVDATLNTLAILVRTRPSTAQRIANTVMGFNPLKLANSPMTSKTRVLMKSMEKTTRMLLMHLVKRDPHNPMTPRLQQQAERLMRSKMEIFDEGSRKRALEAQQAAAYDNAKRQRTEAAIVPSMIISPLGPGQHSLGQVYTLTTNEPLKTFDVTQVPSDIAARISISTLTRVDPQMLMQAINGVRERLVKLQAEQPIPLNPDTAPLGVDDDDDEYEPDLYPAEDTEQIMNKLDSEPSNEVAPRMEAASLALGAFKLPPAPSLGPDMSLKAGEGTAMRVFGLMQSIEDAASKRPKAGVNRLAASSYDKESWMMVFSRMATRAPNTPRDEGPVVKSESMELERAHGQRPLLSNAVREVLYAYILEDFRRRIDVAVSWLCEEWYNDHVRQRQEGDKADLHYDKSALQLIDGFFPYLHNQDKLLTRFLGEIPELNVSILARVKNLCRDPSMIGLAITSLMYLVLMKPPVRAVALDAVQDIWVEFKDAKPMAGKLLTKWRPGFIEAHASAAQALPAPAVAVPAMAT